MSGTILNGGWTTHGHVIEGIPQDASMKPGKVARCGGPKLCGKCARDQANAQSAFHGFAGESTIELANVVYDAMPWEGETYQAAAESIAAAVVLWQSQKTLDHKPDTNERLEGITFMCPRCDRPMLVLPLISNVAVKVQAGKTYTTVRFTPAQIEHDCPTTNIFINN